MKPLRIVVHWLSISFIIFIVTADDSPCDSEAGRLSCGSCIKQNPNCAWCSDPHSTVSSRCQQKSFFTDSVCNPNYVYAPVTEMKISPQTLPIETRQGDRIIQLEPQQIVLRMKAGETLTVPFKYIHKNQPGRPPLTDFQVQTSAWEKTGAQLEFLINCNGAEISGTKCAGISEGQVVEWKIKATLKECTSSGDIAISIGVIGYQSVSAIFITPLCGCDCEKLQRQEKNSVLCHQYGNLICGQCICDPTRGGSKCECPLKSYGVQTAAELDDKCREKPGADICSGKGACRCGQCECDRKLPTIGGKFCECDHDSCPRGVNGKLCSGNGVCQCGTCKCEDGYSREDCSCKSDDSQCIESGMLCNNRGKCECSRCVCDNGFSGLFCGSQDKLEKPTRVSVEERGTTESTAEGGQKEEEGDEANEESQDEKSGGQQPKSGGDNESSQTGEGTNTDAQNPEGQEGGEESAQPATQTAAVSVSNTLISSFILYFLYRFMIDI